MGSTAKIIRFFIELARVLVGGTFLFSGFVKAIDPLGFAYKIEDYLIELQLVELFPFALPVAIFMVVTEFVLGVTLLLGIYRKWTIRFIGLFMVFYTPLTLWIAITNPVEDCGCFGDAFTISNWQTFFKNLILLLGTLLLLLQWQRLKPLFLRCVAPFAAIFTVIFALFFSLFNVYRFPVMDFRPYHIGANISEQMHVDPEKADVIETIFIYSKDGEEREFTEENYPWSDSTWTYVDRRTRVVKEGEKPKIEDFSLGTNYYDESDDEWHSGGDITDLILSDPSYQFIMIALSLEDMRELNLERYKEIHRYAQHNGYPFYLLTASAAQEIGAWEMRRRTGFQFIHADERVLKTMIRSNPGLMLLKEGTVINKWDDRGLPLFDEMDAPLETSALVMPGPKRKTETRRLVIIALLFCVPLLCMKGCERRKRIRDDDEKRRVYGADINETN